MYATFYLKAKRILQETQLFNSTLRKEKILVFTSKYTQTARNVTNATLPNINTDQKMYASINFIVIKATYESTILTVHKP